MSSSCRIFVNNSAGEYEPGQLVTGDVKLTLRKRKKVRGVYIRFDGGAKTEWTESETIEEGTGDDRKSVTVYKTYSSHETYFDSKTYLVRGEIYLDPGVHTYNFSFQLPYNIPSSFEGEYGHIRYSINVVLIIPWGFDIKHKHPFKVMKRLDLNDRPSLHRPVVVDKEHVYYPCFLLCCCPSDPVKIIATIPVGGYTPGQTVNLTLDVDNESNQRIPHFTMELIKYIKYYAQGETKTQHFSKSEVVRSSRGVEMSQRRQICINLQIPTVLPTEDTTCGIIKFEYYILLKVESGTLCSDPSMHIPITIGTIPFASRLAHFEERILSEYNAFVSVVTVQPSAPQFSDISNEERKIDSIPPYPIEDLPTYQDALTNYKNEKSPHNYNTF